jgi:hypothetical protein
MKEWEQLRKSALFSEEELVYLRMSEDLLKDDVEDLLDAWRGVVFDVPYLSAYYEDPQTHQVDTEYAKAVRKRFGQQVEEGNVRLKKPLGGGPLMDMGVYCINAARYLFRAEPQEVIAFGANNGEPRFSEVHEMASVIARFPGERLATFTCSFGAAPIDSYRVVGTLGDLRVSPCYEYHDEITIYLTKNDREHKETISKHDQFGAELLYFSQCVLDNKDPEPDGREGLADVRIVEAVLQSMRSGQAVKLEPFEKSRRPDEAQKIELRPVKPREVVHAESPSGRN